jgi:hypothetical protein
MTRLKKVPGVRNLYRDPHSQLYYMRSQQGGVSAYISLNTTRKEQAIKNMEELRGNQFRKRHEIPEEEEAGPSPLLGGLLDKYREAGYPNMRQKPRDKDSSYFRDQEAYYTMLKKFFAQKFESELRPALLNEYHRWRTNPERLKAGATGDRITDLELTCLSNTCTWAASEDIIKVNRIKNRTRYQSSKDVRHCKELAPEDMDDVHLACVPFFSDRRSEVLGWQATFAAMSGVRTCEALALRTDAKPGEPGALSSDGGSIYVRRAHKSAFENNVIALHEGLQEWRSAHLEWLKKRHPNSPWYFPSVRGGGAEHVSKCVLTNRFKDLFESNRLDRRFSGHGMRAPSISTEREWNGCLPSGAGLGRREVWKRWWPVQGGEPCRVQGGAP